MSTIIFIFFSGVLNIIRDILSPNPEIGGALFVFPGNGKGCGTFKKRRSSAVFDRAGFERVKFYCTFMIQSTVLEKPA